jgi:uncharacterized protein YacL (UPF0231 family)
MEKEVICHYYNNETNFELNSLNLIEMKFKKIETKQKT